MTDEVAGRSISARDFCAAMKRAKQELGEPALSKSGLGDGAMRKITEESWERKPSAATVQTPEVAPSPRPVHKSSRKAEKLREKELAAKAKEKQGALW